MWGMIKKLWRTDDGLTTVEYVLLVMLIVVGGVVAWTALGTQVETIVEAGANSF